MADVWISRRRWTCKYCNVTINDDVPSRRHHENGARHKQNVARSLNDLYRESHIRRATSGAPAPKVARDSAGRGTFENYTTAASLGFSSEDEKKWHERFSQRTGEAKVGEWQTIQHAPTVPSEDVRPQGHVHAGYADPGRPLTDRDEARKFELVERTLDSGDDDIDNIPIITRAQKEEPAIKMELNDKIMQGPQVSTSEATTVRTTNLPMKTEPSAETSSEATHARGTCSSIKREAPESLEDTPPAGPADANPFRKRRARGPTKKVGGSAFA